MPFRHIQYQNVTDSRQTDRIAISISRVNNVVLTGDKMIN